MFYKYRNFYDEKGNIDKRTERILEDGEMFFAKPSKFEDVHDCEVNLELYAENSGIRKYFREELFKISPESKQIIMKLYWGNPQKFKEDFNSGKLIDYKKKSADFMAIFCMCKNPKKKEMWKEYASMGGICIGYDTKIIGNSEGIIFKENINVASNFLPFIPVEYRDTGHPKINRLPTEKFKKEVKECFLVKDEKWSFEEEVRAFVHQFNLGKPLNENGIALHCSDDTIKQIIFSEKADSETIKKVKELINSRSCGQNGVSFFKVDDTYQPKNL